MGYYEDLKISTRSLERSFQHFLVGAHFLGGLHAFTEFLRRCGLFFPHNGVPPMLLLSNRVGNQPSLICAFMTGIGEVAWSKVDHH